MTITDGKLKACLLRRVILPAGTVVSNRLVSVANPESSVDGLITVDESQGFINDINDPYRILPSERLPRTELIGTPFRLLYRAGTSRLGVNKHLKLTHHWYAPDTGHHARRILPRCHLLPLIFKDTAMFAVSASCS